MNCSLRPFKAKDSNPAGQWRHKKIPPALLFNNFLYSICATVAAGIEKHFLSKQKAFFLMCFWIKKLKQIVKLGVGVRAREKIVVFKSEFNWSATNRKLTLSLNIFQNDYAAVYTPT